MQVNNFITVEQKNQQFIAATKAAAKEIAAAETAEVANKQTQYAQYK